MARQNINNTPADSGLGDSLKLAFDKVNAMTLELYAADSTFADEIDLINVTIAKVNDGSLLNHTHTIAQIQGLQSTLNSKISASTYIGDMMAINASIQAINNALNDIVVILNTKVEEAPFSGITYGRNNGSWVPLTGITSQDTYVTGGTYSNGSAIFKNNSGGTFSVTGFSKGSVTSVGLSMPSAFAVSDSPITSAGTISVTATGATNQFIKGDGTLGTTVTKTSELINDGDNGSTHFISLEDLPSNLILYATTAASDISGYSKLVTSLTDPSYNTGATDVSTGAITGTAQLISSLASPANIIIGNPGVFNITTVGNIRKTNGSGDATFYFQAYKRTSGGTETLVAISDNTLPIGNGTYSEFFAIGLWNDGIFTSTDRIVLKFYANRIAGGSNPTFQFQFGGSTPVRTFVPIPLNVTPGSSYIRRHSFTNFDGSNSYSYNGYAVQGSSESANVWTITRLTINAFGISTRAYATNVAWTNRLSVTYTT